MYYVYILRCSDGSLYIGHTANLDSRLQAHNTGLGAAHTFRRRPVTLTYSEPHSTRVAAIHRERQLKRWTRKKKEALIRGDFEGLKALSKRRQRSAITSATPAQDEDSR